MSARLSGGSLGRWYEQLCRIKHVHLSSIVTDSQMALRPKLIPHAGGVYVFWWTGCLKLLANRNMELVLDGPGRREIHISIDDEWLGLQTNLPIPLYIGKNADNLAFRIGKHLRLKDRRMLPLAGGLKKAKRPTTLCQLRGGIEHLFPNVVDTRKLILENVGLSYVTLSGDEHAVNRFYLEDLAIGMMHPPINLDVER